MLLLLLLLLSKGFEVTTALVPCAHGRDNTHHACHMPHDVRPLDAIGDGLATQGWL